jgi:hypothetical protein
MLSESGFTFNLCGLQEKLKLLFYVINLVGAYTTLEILVIPFYQINFGRIFKESLKQSMLGFCPNL